jgi:hypothetical protein
MWEQAQSLAEATHTKAQRRTFTHTLTHTHTQRDEHPQATTNYHQPADANTLPLSRPWPKPNPMHVHIHCRTLYVTPLLRPTSTPPLPHERATLSTIGSCTLSESLPVLGTQPPLPGKRGVTCACATRTQIRTNSSPRASQGWQACSLHTSTSSASICNSIVRLRTLLRL